MSRKPSKPETRIEDYLDVMTGGNAALPQPILRIEFYYAFLAGMTVELPQPILDDEKLLAKICGMEVEAPTYIPGLFPRLYAYMAKKGGQDVQVPDPILRLERYWYDYSAGEAPSVQEYTGAAPVTFIADGTPLLDYIISGNTIQNGTPTPDSPIMPQGTGERTGNLWDITPNANIGYNQDVDSDVSEDPGSLRVSASDNGMILTADSSWAGTAWKIQARVGMTYYISFASTSSNIRATIYTADGNNKVARRIANYSTNFPDNKELTILSNERYIVINISVNAIATVEVIKPMIATDIIPYEPYGYKIPISSANTTTPVYLGEVQTERKIGKIDLGTLDWGKTSSGNFWSDNFISDMKVICNADTGNAICTTFKEVTPNAVASTPYAFSSCLNNQQRPFVNKTGFENLTAEEFKQAMSGVYMYYVLANEGTAVVNEPLMKIGDYADTVSMEQAGVSIPTANGSTTLDVETTVPPSEIYIKYRGEAVATLSSLPAEVSNPEETTEEKNPEEMEEEENEC